MAATPVLLVVVVMRRRLPETSRFGVAAAAGQLAGSWRNLFYPPHRRPLVLVCAASALASLLTQPFVFVIDFMQTQRHLPASTATLVLVGAGAIAIPVLAGAGAASDRFGRKRMGCSFLAFSIAGALCFFLWARSPAALFAALAVTLIGQFGAWPTLSGFTTELFPTSHRALARSAAGAASVAGQCGSFLLAAALIGLTGSPAGAVIVLAARPRARPGHRGHQPPGNSRPGTRANLSEVRAWPVTVAGPDPAASGSLGIAKTCGSTLPVLISS